MIQPGQQNSPASSTSLISAYRRNANAAAADVRLGPIRELIYDKVPYRIASTLRCCDDSQTIIIWRVQSSGRGGVKSQKVFFLHPRRGAIKLKWIWLRAASPGAQLTSQPVSRWCPIQSILLVGNINKNIIITQSVTTWTDFGGILSPYHSFRLTHKIGHRISLGSSKRRKSTFQKKGTTISSNNRRTLLRLLEWRQRREEEGEKKWKNPRKVIM